VATILIVDDDKDLAGSQKLLLEDSGYEVEVAYSMEEALSRLQTIKPDLILSDLMMEHFDTGFILGKKVRDLPGYENIPIIIQTGASKKIGFTFDSSLPDTKKWLKVDEIIDKPVTPEYLLGKIAQHFEK